QPHRDHEIGDDEEGARHQQARAAGLDGTLGVAVELDDLVAARRRRIRMMRTKRTRTGPLVRHYSVLVRLIRSVMLVGGGSAALSFAGGAAGWLSAAAWSSAAVGACAAGSGCVSATSGGRRSGRSSMATIWVAASGARFRWRCASSASRVGSLR